MDSVGLSLPFLLDDLNLYAQQILCDLLGGLTKPSLILLRNTMETLLASLRNSKKQPILKQAYRIYRCRHLRGEVEGTKLLQNVLNFQNILKMWDIPLISCFKAF